MTDDTARRNNARRNEGYLDLRELIERFDEMGELARIDGADWNLEIGALSETSAAARPVVFASALPAAAPSHRKSQRNGGEGGGSRSSGQSRSGAPFVNSNHIDGVRANWRKLKRGAEMNGK